VAHPILNNLNGWDVALFVGYSLLLLGIGLYLTRRQTSLQSFLVADRNVHWTIVGVSVLAALFSGVTYLGAPAEGFFHDLTYLWAVAALLIATPVTTRIFLPLFRESNIYTAYEYLERRFDRRLRHLASGLFIVRVTFYLAVAIYAPSLAVMEVTGWPLWTAVLLTAACATIYTALGGMRAVIWTDSLQFLVLCGGIALIIAFAAWNVPGGLTEAWRVAGADGKTSLLHLSPDPRVRLTVWGCILGGASNALVQLVTDQMAVQRYLTAPSLRDSQRALWLKLWMSLPLIPLFYITGTILYAYYRVTPDAVPYLKHANLVPALAQSATTSPPLESDRILPYFVMHTLPSPLRGLLIAALFGATIGTVSAGVHSLATATIVDFFGAARTTRDATVARARLLIVVFGTLCSVLALAVIPRLGTIVEAVVTIMGLFGGPLLGVFLLGALTRRPNANSALFGAALGAATGAIVAFSRPLLGVELSFMWISFVATAVTFLSGWLAGIFSSTPRHPDRPIITEVHHA
jgi:sodium-coupled monocarboxylate transporter 8/12